MNFPILSSLILLPSVGALFLFFTKDKDGNNLTAKYVALFTSAVNFLISIYLWISFDQSTSNFQFIEDRAWIEGFINYKVGVDGISILFIILTTFITPLCIISVNNSVKTRLRDFLIAILIMESFMIGVFCALDLVVFYLFFEAGLIPMFLIIGIWGGPKRVYSAFKFFLYTLLGSVLMLVAIISIYWISGTTDVIKLYELGIDTKYQNLLWLAFFSSFAVKTPMWPVHTWLPDAHVEAPSSGSVILAAVLLKVGGYGMIRFLLPIAPDAGFYLNTFLIPLSLIAIIYISFVALAQEDMKKLIAYSSVAHMGFVTLGIFLVFNSIYATNSLSEIAHIGLQGAVMQMLSHGLISAGLFMCIGVIYTRTHSRMINKQSGIGQVMPLFSALMMFFLLSNSGLPGTSGFVGEFMVLISSLENNIIYAVLASTTLVLAASYSLWLGRRILFGDISGDLVAQMKQLKPEEFWPLIILVVAILILGIKPMLLLSFSEQSSLYIINAISKGY